MKRILTSLALIASAVSCSTKDQSKALVLYYSQTGATQVVAEEIAKQIGADIERIDITQPYNGTYDETIQRCNEERANGTLPELVPLKSKLSEYDVIFIGYPIWYGTCALPMISLLETVDAGEKTIVPFCTFGSGGLESSYIDIKKNWPDANIKDGFGIRNARISKAAKEVERFLIAGGYKEGEVENIPEFPEQQEVGDEEIAIFNAACSSYPMPLGSPVSFASRETSDGTEFLYTAESQGRDGNKSYSKVYVVVGNEEGSVPEFTKVIR